MRPITIKAAVVLSQTRQFNDSEIAVLLGEPEADIRRAIASQRGATGNWAPEGHIGIEVTIQSLSGFKRMEKTADLRGLAATHSAALVNVMVEDAVTEIREAFR